LSVYGIRCDYDLNVTQRRIHACCDRLWACQLRTQDRLTGGIILCSVCTLYVLGPSLVLHTSQRISLRLACTLMILRRWRVFRSTIIQWCRCESRKLKTVITYSRCVMICHILPMFINIWHHWLLKKLWPLHYTTVHLQRPTVGC
jgi:hypothetical protein